MTDHDDPPPGFPGGYVRIIADANVGDDEMSGGGNRMFSSEEMEAAFGKHPQADWKYVPTPAKDWVGRKRKRPRR